MTNAAAERELRDLLARSEELGAQLREMATELTGYVETLAVRASQEDGGALDAQ